MSGERIVCPDKQFVVEVVDEAEVCGVQGDAQESPHQRVKSAGLGEKEGEGRCYMEGLAA